MQLPSSGINAEYGGGDGALLHEIFSPPYRVPSLAEAIFDSGLSNPSQVCELCLQFAGQVAREAENLYMSQDDIGAIALYTFDYGPNGSTNPYTLINRALYTHTVQNLHQVRGLMYLLLSALRKLHKVVSSSVPSGHFYRGITRKVDTAEYTKGKKVTWPSFSSTTTDMEVTKGFLKDKTGQLSGTLFEIQNAWGYDIKPFSLISGEKEILLEPGREFEVVSVVDGAMYVIQLNMKETPLLFAEHIDTFKNVDFSVNHNNVLRAVNSLNLLTTPLPVNYQQKLLQCLCRYTEIYDSTSESTCANTNMVRAVCKVLEYYIGLKNVGIITYACCLLKQLTQFKDCRTHFNNSPALLAKAIEENINNSSIVEKSLEVFEFLSRYGKCELFPFLKPVLQAMELYEVSCKIQVIICKILARITTSRCGKDLKPYTEQIINRVNTSLQLHSADATIGEYGLKVLECVGLKLDCASSLSCSPVFSVMKGHPANINIQITACKVLGLISSCDFRFLTTLELKDCVVQAIEAHPTDCRLKQAVHVLLESVLIMDSTLGTSATRFISALMERDATPPSFNLPVKIVEKEGLLLVISSLKTNSTLTTLDITGSDIGTCGAALCESLKQNVSLTSLNLENCILEKAAFFLGEALKVNCSLLVLNLACKELYATGFGFIMQGLSKNTTVTTLILEGKRLDDEISQVLACFLASINSLTTVNISRCNINSKSQEKIYNALKVNRMLHSLSCNDNGYCSSPAVKALAEALVVNTTLSCLSLQYLLQSSEQVQFLGKALKVNNTLTSLDISSTNCIDDTAVEVLASTLSVNSTLKILGLGGADFENLNGLKLLTAAISKQSTIVSIAFMQARWSPDGLSYLCEFLKTDKSLTSLDLTGLNPTSAELLQIAETLKVNTSLKSLLIRCTNFDEAKPVTEILRASKSLTYLNLGGPEAWDPNAVKALASGLKETTSLVTLDLPSSNALDNRDRAFFETLSSSKFLKRFSMSENQVPLLEGESLYSFITSNTSVLSFDLTNCNQPPTTKQWVVRALCVRREEKHKPVLAFLLGHYISDDSHNNLLKLLPVHLLKIIFAFYRTLTTMQVQYLLDYWVPSPKAEDE
eukprot:TRINITY_DN2249_c0_g1_i27.p1 TRINITY_DN2249_c0_g1~~TRINITY_DN2249_c0_g1_i27.p1  ORF type:complete len:1104 (-),score=184.52 TRINITY_DN2249_c0_g1_i27:92-3403(-)